MRYKTDIIDTEKQTPTDDDIRGADVCYEYGDCLKETLTWDKVCEQLDKPIASTFGELIQETQKECIQE